MSAHSLALVQVIAPPRVVSLPPVLPTHIPSISLGEWEIAAQLTTDGIWHVHRKIALGKQPIFVGTTTTRAAAVKGCTDKYRDYICLMPHDTLMSPETTDDPTPFLCYPLDPAYETQNTRDAVIFAKLEAEKGAGQCPNCKLHGLFPNGESKADRLIVLLEEMLVQMRGT